MEANNVLNTLIASSPLLMALAPYGALMKFWINKDNVSKDELEKILAAFRKDVAKAQEDDKSYLHALDKRSQDIGKEVAEMKGRMSN